MDADPSLAVAAPPPRPVLAGRARAPWNEVILLAGLTMFGSVAMDMYLPAMPRMAADLRATPQQAQATISVFLFGLAVAQLVIGPWSDRIGRRPPILGGVVLFCLATGVCAAASDVRLLIGARLVQAFAACSGMVVSRAVVRDRYQDHEVLHVFALLTLVFAVAPVAAPLIGGWVLAAGSWRWIFAIQAGFGLLVGAAAFFRLPESRSQATRLKAEGENMVASYRALLGQPRFTGYLLTGALSGAALFSYIATAPRVIMGEFHIAPQHFGYVFGANAVGVTLGAQVNARLARRIAGDRLLQGALVAALAAGVVLLAAAWTGSGGLWGVLVPLFLVISALGFSQPNATAAAMAVDRERAGATAALLGAAFFGVGSLSGTATSLLPGRASTAMGAVVVATLALALLAYRTLVAPRLRGT